MWVCVFFLCLALKAMLLDADFQFYNFNNTDGLIFLGDAGTTNCYNDTSLAYGDVQYKADRFNEDVIQEISETTDFISESSVETNIESSNKDADLYLAGFLNRNDTVPSPTTCSQRVRLTPSGPSKIGAVWFRDMRPVTNGFDTYFSFQITDHSRECTLVKDQYFSKFHHRTCSVRGADGFAFVIQNSINGTFAIGNDGGQMGFGGVDNSLAIAFDTWTNPGQDTMFTDHVSIQSRGYRSNNGLESGLLGVPRTQKLADGKIHVARVVYYGELKSEYFDFLVASESLIEYLKDNGEQKRIGTLLVFLDEGIESDTPLLALPINLSLLLNMPDDKAYVGFTSSTGRFYEKHDIISWIFCDQEPCKDETSSAFDYHLVSRHYSVGLQRYDPGGGYGGGDNTRGFPIKNQDPDTTAVSEPIEHFAKDRNIGLSEDASEQIPPNTIF